MAYNSAHTGPEIDAAVQLLGEIQEAKDTTAADRQAVTSMAATVATQAAQVNAQAAQVSSNTAVVLASASAVEADRAEVEQNTGVVLSAKTAAQEAGAAAVAAQGAVEGIQQSVSQSQIAAGHSERSASESASAAREDRVQVELLAQQTAEDSASAAESAAAAAAVVTGGTAALNPEPGKIPLAKGDGKIDEGWLPAGIARESSLGEISEQAEIAISTADAAQARTARFLESAAAPPEQRDDGLPLQPGDRYFNTASQSEFIYKDGDWQENDSLAAIDSLKASLSSQAGASEIGYEEETVSDALGNVKTLSNYDQLRSYLGSAEIVRISSGGVEGFFKRLPSGQIYLDDNGITLVSENSAAWRRSFSGEIRISWFMPANDGVSSDSSAINAALLANHNRGGGAVTGDSMLWRLGETLHYGKNTSLFLNSKARMIRGHAGDVLRNDIGITSATTGYAGNGNMELWGGQWEGNPAGFYNTFSFLQIGYLDRATIKHATFLDSIRSHVADLSAVRNVLFEDCYFLGFAGAASGSEPTPASAFTEAVQLDPNIPSSFPFGARDGTASSNITLRRCKFGPNPNQLDPRFGSWGCAIGQHGSLHNLFMRGIRVEDCDFEGITYSAIRGMRWVDVWIENNRFVNCRRGVHATPIPYNSSSANNFDGTPSGVGQTGRNWNLKGNTYDGFIDNAIVFAEIAAFNTSEDIFFHEDITVDGETFRNGPNNAALALRYCSGVKVGVNHYENVMRGVDLDCSRDSDVVGAVIKGVVQQFALIKENYLVSGKPSPTRNNNISGATGASVGLEFARVDCPAKDTNVFNNNVSGVCNSNSALAAVAYYGGALGGLVVGNTLRGTSTVKPSYGLYVDVTASGITDCGNSFEFTAQAVSNNGISKPPASLGPVAMDMPQIGAYGTGTLQLGHWVAGAWSPKVQISSAGNVTPVAGGTYNLGSSSLPWAAVFAVQLRTTGEVRFAGLGNYANDAAAAAGGVAVTGIYRNGSALMVRVS